MPAKRKKSSSSFFDPIAYVPPGRESAKPYLSPKRIPTECAIVYCEGNFGGMVGKIANELVRHSEEYEILSIIDSEKAGQDAGKVLDDDPNGIPICRDLDEALSNAGRVPDFFIFGLAPANGVLSPIQRQLILTAIAHGLHIVYGRHQSLNDDPEFAAACAKSGVVIREK